MDLQLKGKRAPVTSGSKGIGKAIGQALATAARNRIRDLVDATEVADVVVFLCAPRSHAIKGQHHRRWRRHTQRPPLLNPFNPAGDHHENQRTLLLRTN
jgi:hypothetical protein